MDRRKLLGDFGEKKIENFIEGRGWSEIENLNKKSPNNPFFDISSTLPNGEKALIACTSRDYQSRAKMFNEIEETKMLSICENKNCIPYIGLYFRFINDSYVFVMSLYHYKKEYWSGSKVRSLSMESIPRVMEDSVVMHEELLGKPEPY